MNEWPVLKSYEGKQLRRIALPLGGVGTGTVSLGGRGNLQDWAIMNTPAVGYTPTSGKIPGLRNTGPFFALYTEKQNGDRACILLESALDPEVFEASEGSREPNHGLPRFRAGRFDAAYPAAQIHFFDDSIPLKVSLKAFNPLIPGDADKSGYPAAVLTYVLKNDGDEDVNASICSTMLNIAGQDGREFVSDWRWDGGIDFRGNRGAVNEIIKKDGLCGIKMSCSGRARRSAAWGDFSISTDAVDVTGVTGATGAIDSGDDAEISFRTSWAQKSWGDSLLDFWDDFSEDGRLSPRSSRNGTGRMASMAVKQTIPAGESREIRFYLSWYFPNRETWHPLSYKSFGRLRYLWHGRIGNYYCRSFSDSWDAAVKLKEELPRLEQMSLRFVDSFLKADLPDAVKEAALFNISTLRTQTCFRSRSGYFYGWEGIHDGAGSCMGSCTHVWNYEQTTPFLFGELARSMREVEFLHSTRRNGHMRFRTHLPMWLNRLNRGVAAADGQMGTIMKAYREWQLCGDDSFLIKIWPAVKRALAFCWLPGGWDADRDGVMEGCQHNTMDVEYYGPNPQMQGWYLGALRAAEEMAGYLEDRSFAADCRRLFEAGSAYMDETLFNGEYYEQIIRVPKRIRRGLTASMGSKNLEEPILQIGSGCLVDQLVGQYMAHICGLGYLVKEENVRTTLRSIMKYNFKEDFHHHFNHLRSYVFNDESALLMASYPHGNRPEQPFPYFNEVMTGFEHSTAAHMLFEGGKDPELYESGLRVIEAVRSRYDGFKRNPYDEAECGHHYARAMAAWAHVLAVSGFRYSAVDSSVRFAEREAVHFWASGDAWGLCSISRDGGSWSAKMECLGGKIGIKEFFVGTRRIYAGEQIRLKAAASSGRSAPPAQTAVFGGLSGTEPAAP